MIFELLEQSPTLAANFERWSDEYGVAANWGKKLDEFLRARGLEPQPFWGG
ncbi:hypothetical protein ACFP81_04820 [Deinococcus lacus]|uniref:Uncharacterized protein n=1 Tax=Deinococcus lacus TaxID=392561 RepID=A0ABW1YCY8_9DEIO